MENWLSWVFFDFWQSFFKWVIIIFNLRTWNIFQFLKFLKYGFIKWKSWCDFVFDNLIALIFWWRSKFCNWKKGNGFLCLFLLIYLKLLFCNVRYIFNFILELHLCRMQIPKCHMRSMIKLYWFIIWIYHFNLLLHLFTSWFCFLYQTNFFIWEFFMFSYWLSTLFQRFDYSDFVHY